MTVHIAAYMAACDVDDLDRTAKEALKAVCGRIDYPATSTTASLARLARDMSRRKEAVREAVFRLEDAGYLVVDNRRGMTSVIRLRLARFRLTDTPGGATTDTPGGAPTDTPGGATPTPPGVSHKDLLDKNRLFLEARARAAAGSDDVDNAPHDPGCWRCQGQGWIDSLAGGGVVRCPGPDLNLVAPVGAWPSHTNGRGSKP